MEQFWKWMKNKGYGDINSYTKTECLNGPHSTVGTTKQMLIGYLIEYALGYMGKEIEGPNAIRFLPAFSSVDDLFNDLVNFANSKSN